jgi:hypothetical protein
MNSEKYPSIASPKYMNDTIIYLNPGTLSPFLTPL